MRYHCDMALYKQNWLDITINNITMIFNATNINLIVILNKYCKPTVIKSLLIVIISPSPILCMTKYQNFKIDPIYMYIFLKCLFIIYAHSFVYPSLKFAIHICFKATSVCTLWGKTRTDPDLARNIIYFYFFKFYWQFRNYIKKIKINII